MTIRFTSSLLRGCVNKHGASGGTWKKEINAGLTCSFMAQTSIQQKLRQLETIKDVLAVKVWLP
mgnify:CR=1 FL=1